MKKAIFFDRDGVINKVVFRNGNYQKPIAPWNINEFKIFPGIKKSFCNLKNLGFKIFVVTNQPDIAKGIIDSCFVSRLNKIILQELPVDEIAVCPHEDKNMCDCRKPKPGMIVSLSKKWGVDCKNSFLVGDSWKDIEAGETAQCTTMLLERHYNTHVKADYKIKNLCQAFEKIRLIIKIYKCIK